MAQELTFGTITGDTTIIGITLGTILSDIVDANFELWIAVVSISVADPVDTRYR